MVVKRRIILTTLAALVGGAFALFMIVPDRSEPVYQGKKLSEWLYEWSVDESHGVRASENKAGNAIRQIGTNAIPTLIGWLRAKDGSLKTEIIEWTESYPRLPFHPRSARNKNLMAIQALEILGPIAKPASPQLFVLLKDSDPIRRARVAAAIWVCDPEAAKRANIPLPSIIE